MSQLTDQTLALAKIIRERRTTHRFQPEPAPDMRTIKTLLETAIWAPNHWKYEPWHFYLIGTETKQKLCDYQTRKLHEAGKEERIINARAERWGNIPGWILVTSDISEKDIETQENYAAVSCAVQNLLLLLQSEGFESKWSTATVIRDAEFADICGIDTEKAQIAGLVWFGKGAETKEGKRAPLADKLTELP